MEGKYFQRFKGRTNENGQMTRLVENSSKLEFETVDNVHVACSQVIFLLGSFYGTGSTQGQSQRRESVCECENCSSGDLETMEKLDSKDKAKILERGNAVTS